MSKDTEREIAEFAAEAAGTPADLDPDFERLGVAAWEAAEKEPPPPRTVYLITFQIGCGELTCAVEPGKFCGMYRPSLNSPGACHLFGPLTEQDGWTRRHRKCLEVARPAAPQPYGIPKHIEAQRAAAAEIDPVYAHERETARALGMDLAEPTTTRQMLLAGQGGLGEPQDR